MSLKEKILIADDSEMNQMLLEEILSDKYEYVMAKDGTEAVDILEKNEDIDLVMLDINMPKMDGFDVLEIMNLRHWISEVPVIIISSENDVDFIRRGYDLGASDYISRPFDLTVVRRRVENTLMLYARQKRLVRLVEEQVYEREKTNNTMINILSHVIEYRNNESGQHILHVRTMTDILLRRLIEITDLGMFSLNGLRTPDPLMYEYVKKWIKTQSRFSTLISGSGELRRIHYFKRQREIVAQLG